MGRQFLVFADKEFKITIPDGARVTFGPWSPPTEKSRYDNDKRGTLRIYAAQTASSDVLAVFAGVTSFRDLSQIEYIEKVAVEEGATVWHSDQNGYSREEKVSVQSKWIAKELPGTVEEDPAF